MLKRLMLRKLAVGVMALLVLSIVVLVFVFAQEEQLDSTQMKLIQERVKVAIKTSDQYKLLKDLGIECPPFDSTDGRAWELTMNQWQRMQLEKKGIGVSVLSGLKPEEEPRRIEYKLVKEIDLGRDGVENIVFGPKKDRSSALSEIILGLEDEGKGVTRVSVYDFNFNLIGEMHLSNVTFSKNLRYIGGIEYEKVTQDGSEKWMYKFQLFDYTGKKLWEFKERELYEVNSTYSISNRGTVIELGHGSGVVTFIDQNGSEIKKVKLCNSSGTPGAGIGGGTFSEDGEYALVIVDKSCPDTLDERGRVMFFSWDGRELGRFLCEENNSIGASISTLGSYVMATSLVWPPLNYNYPPDKKSTYLLSNKGELIKKYENMLASSICFSSNEKYALFDSYGTLLLIDLPSGEVLFKYGRWGGLFQQNCLDIAEEARLFGSATATAVILLGVDGTKVWSHPLSSEGGGVTLRLSDDGKQIIIAFGSKIMIYQQEE
jgi:hypothetical protein